MGAGTSSILDEDGCHETGLGDLPESCVAAVLLHLDPLEICGIAKLGRTFRGAASADFLWEKKLPSNYRYLMELVAAQEGEEKKTHRRSRCPQKQIFELLSRPIYFDGSTKLFWLEKGKGGVCMAISSKALLITGIDDRRYWNFVPTEQSRFRTVAYLQQIWWFEVDGEIDFYFPAGTYSLFFRVHLGRVSKRLGRRSHIDHIHGWDIKPVQFQLSTSDGQHSSSQYHLDEPGAWVLYPAGDFTVGSADLPTKLRFSMIQIDCTHTKGGLCLDSVLIYPKGFKPDKVLYHSEEPLSN